MDTGQALDIIEKLKINNVNGKLFPVINGGCTVVIECENIHHVITGKITDLQINNLTSYLINNGSK